MMSELAISGNTGPTNVVQLNPRQNQRSLPLPLSTLIGRNREVEAVAEYILDPAIRLITLTGPGGVGKTRLASHVAASVSTDLSGEANFVDLSIIRDSDLFLPTLLSQMGIPNRDSRQGLDLFRDVVGTRETLLILDNFEHVLPAASLVSELLHLVPNLTIIVTSRALLNTSGEWVLQVPALSVPTAAETNDRLRSPERSRDNISVTDLLGYEGIQLFVERSQAKNPGFEVTAENADDVENICVRLEGIPLAIELAAARTAFYSPAELIEQLDTRLPLLTGGPRDLPDRQRTMRDTISWSYDLLDPVEQAVLNRLSVVVGGCTTKAAVAVCRDPLDRNPTEPESVIAALESLVRQSMVAVVHPSNAPGNQPASRLTLLDVVREFADEKLYERNEHVQIGRQHAEYFSEVAK